MTLDIPVGPKDRAWGSKEKFPGCKYVYIRLEDFSVGENAPEYIVQYMEDLEKASARSEAESGHASYGIVVMARLAEDLWRYANGRFTGVRDQETPMTMIKSQRYEAKRPPLSELE